MVSIDSLALRVLKRCEAIVGGRMGGIECLRQSLAMVNEHKRALTVEQQVCGSAVAVGDPLVE